MIKQKGIISQNKINANIVGASIARPNKHQNGITLIALIISIIIMLILAGVVLNLTIGERGIFNTASDASRKYIIEEMREELNLALSDLQLEKKGKATLDDVTQDWADGTKLKEYQTQITEEAGIEGKIATMHKNGITGRFIIGGSLNVTEDEQANPNPPTPSKNQHSVTINLGEGLTIDNNSKTVTEDSKYEANIKAGLEYIIDSLTVKMGGQVVTTGGNNIVDEATGKIKIEKVTGDIEIIGNSVKISTNITTPIIGTETPPTNTVADNSQTRGTKLYINFSASINGQNATITYKEDGKQLPYEVTKNGVYTFVLTVTTNGKTIQKEYDVKVNKYTSAIGVVKYDAGVWTQEEIDELKNLKLYVKTAGGLYNHNGYGVFSDFTVGSSRNDSVDCNGAGLGNTAKYEGWQLMETETKQDANGNTIKNNDGTDRIYVKSIIHAGSPENYECVEDNTDSAYYKVNNFILSGGIVDSEANILRGKEVNPRNWSMYKDKELDKLGYINEVYALTYDEAISLPATITASGKVCWLVGAKDLNNNLLISNGAIDGSRALHYGFGIRPVVTMTDGVYIASGSGTDGDPYILAKE